MADLREKLWPAFVSEVTEQLDGVELLLAKSLSAESIDVNHLFRSFHTIKGSCSMIGFTSMELLAHKSEDILAAVRSEEIAMTDDVVDILLESISRLKKQFHIAHESRENPPQDDKLVAHLVDFLASSKSEASTPAVTIGEQAQQENIQALVNVAKMAVPSLVLGLDANAKADQVENAVKMMADTANGLGFAALSRSLAHYISVLKSDIPDRLSPLLIVAAESFDDIEFICAEFNVDLGLELGARLCRGKLGDNFAQQLSLLAELLEDLSNSTPDNWQVEQFLQLVNYSNVLSCFCSLFRYAELNATWRYIKQLVIEVSRGYILFNHDIIQDLLVIVELATCADDTEEFQQRCRDKLNTLQLTTAKHNNERDEIVQIKEDIVSKSSLSLDSIADLKMDVLSIIDKSIDKGLLAVEIDIDFTDEETSEKVLTAVRSLGELTHSRTMFHDLINGVAQRTSFSFLILTPKPLEDIKRILTIIDQGKGTFTILGLDDEVAVEEAQETTASLETNRSANSTPESDATEELVAETTMSMGALKVEGHAVDQIISDVGELITHHNRLDHLINQDAYLSHINHLKAQLANAENESLHESLQFLESNFLQMTTANENLQTSLNRIQSSVLELRVVPIAYAFNRFHKYVRTTAQKLGKKVILEVVGEQVKIDKGMIDVLSEPLAHMVRNSIDHGIESADVRVKAGKSEQGNVELKAEQLSGMVNITITDDGAGLNRDKILSKCIKQGLLDENTEYSDQDVFQMIFEPGFSTSEVLTETSGRGVGMDVVKSKIQSVGGSVSVRSEEGKGTCLQLRLPISAAIQSVILVENNTQVLALPERYVLEVMSVKTSLIQVIQGQSVMVLRDNIVPLYQLDKVISAKGVDTVLTVDELEIVVIADDRHCAGFVVDSTMGRAEVLVRDVHDSLRYMPAVSGAAILGDGNVVIILDCEGLFQLALGQAQNILGVAEGQLH